MSKYKNAADQACSISFEYIKQRMKEKKVSQKKLSEEIGISVGTMIRYFKKETPMTLPVYFMICGVLELRPYLIPVESDTNEMERMFFN